MHRCLIATLVALSGPAHAADGPAAVRYPVKPIRMIVPVAAGGGTEIVARIVAVKLTEALGQQVVIDNRPGGGGSIGTGMVAAAAPDGYTLLFALASHTVTPFLVRALPYDAATGFTPVTQVASQPLLLTLTRSVAATTPRELIALARANPGRLAIGVASMGGAGHVAAELFRQSTGVEVNTVVYKGGAPMLIALVGGEIQFAFATTITAMNFIKQDKVRVIATASRQRLAYLPEVPTLEEAGVAGFDVTPWQGLLGPARLPRAIVDRLHGEVVKLLKAPDVRERLAATGSDPMGSTPEAFAAQIARELAQFGRVIRNSGLKGE